MALPPEAGEAMTEGVIVAVIGAVGLVLASMVQGLRKENRQDHGTVMGLLTRLENKFDKHIDNHETGVYSPAPEPRKAPSRGSVAKQNRPASDPRPPAKGRRPGK